jgi:hypothetical protein
MSSGKKTLDYWRRGTRAPIARTHAEVNAFVVWMIAFGVIGFAIVLIVAFVRG